MSSFFPTFEQFKSIFPGCKAPDKWFNALQSVLPTYNIVTRNQVVCFLAQCGHESAEFNVLRENFNYSESGLLKIFPKYFTPDQAKLYARNPQKIANRVYANRMGNGPESSGDGFKYRGCGVIQVTGKDNLSKCSMALYNDLRLLDNPEILLDPTEAIRSACWFWNSNNLNTYADVLDMVRLTKKINGGTIGLEARIELFNKIQKLV